MAKVKAEVSSERADWVTCGDVNYLHHIAIGLYKLFTVFIQFSLEATNNRGSPFLLPTYMPQFTLDTLGSNLDVIGCHDHCIQQASFTWQHWTQTQEECANFHACKHNCLPSGRNVCMMYVNFLWRRCHPLITLASCYGAVHECCLWPGKWSNTQWEGVHH